MTSMIATLEIVRFVAAIALCVALFALAVYGLYRNIKETAETAIREEYIASKAPDAKSREEEIAALGVAEVVEKSMTVFPTLEDGTPFLWDYQVKGFFKDACGVLKKVSGTASSKIKAYKKEIDGLVFVEERKIPYEFKGGMGECQRPLRASTPQGERVALAHSETVPAGATVEFTIVILKDDMETAVREWLDYGRLRGICQTDSGTPICEL